MRDTKPTEIFQMCLYFNWTHLVPFTHWRFREYEALVQVNFLFFCLQCDIAVIALVYFKTCLSAEQPVLPHRTCRKTGAWGPDCRPPGGLCRSTAVGFSCTWVPSTQSEGTWLWVQRLVGSCPTAAIPSPADLKYGYKEDSFYSEIVEPCCGRAHRAVFAQSLTNLAVRRWKTGIEFFCKSVHEYLQYSMWWTTLGQRF